MRRTVDTQDQLRVSRISLSLQCSNENVDQSQPQWEKWHRLVMGPSIFLVKFALQQNLKHNIDLLDIGFLSFISHTDKQQRRHLGLDVAKVMRQRQHCKQDVDGSSSQVRRVYIHHEFGKFPGRLKQRGRVLPVNKGSQGKPLKDL